MSEVMWVSVSIAICAYLALGTWVILRRQNKPTVQVFAGVARLPEACSEAQIMQSSSLNNSTQQSLGSTGMSDMEQPEDPARRTFLTRAIFAIGGLMALILAAPFVVYIFEPLRQLVSGSTASTAALGKVADFPEGQVVQKEFTAKVNEGWIKGKDVAGTVFVRNTGGGKYLILSSVCTHLGCQVGWQANTKQFACPCHGGIYDQNGVVIGGPPPKPLSQYEATVQNGDLVIKV